MTNDRKQKGKVIAVSFRFVSMYRQLSSKYPIECNVEKVEVEVKHIAANRSIRSINRPFFSFSYFLSFFLSSFPGRPTVIPPNLPIFLFFKN